MDNPGPYVSASRDRGRARIFGHGKKLARLWRIVKKATDDVASAENRHAGLVEERGLLTGADRQILDLDRIID